MVVRESLYLNFRITRFNYVYVKRNKVNNINKVDTVFDVVKFNVNKRFLGL